MVRKYLPTFAAFLEKRRRHTSQADQRLKLRAPDIFSVLPRDDKPARTD